MRGDALPTGERVYAAVKRQLLTGDILPGERLDAARMAERHAASITPVRAALHRLAGEGLVVATAGEGFHTPRLSEAILRDLYAWNNRCLQQAWQLASPLSSLSCSAFAWSDTAGADPADIVGLTERLFATLGDLSASEQCAEAIERLNDRLHVARGQEVRLFSTAAEEWTALAEAMTKGPSTRFHHEITLYHRRRIRAAADIVHKIHRPGRPT